jgi:hypothetical protein
MSIDPGNTTGITFWILDSEKKPPWIARSHLQITDYKPRNKEHFLAPYVRQARTLNRLWRAFRDTAFYEHSIPHLNHYLVVEDYLPGPSSGTGGRKALAPIYISAAFEGMRKAEQEWYEHLGFGPSHSPAIHWAQPSEKSMVTNEHLKLSGLYIIGQEHARDATRHAVVQARKLGFRGIVRKRTRPVKTVDLTALLPKPVA